MPKAQAIHNQQPIGIFDSGIGGLTVAKAIKQLLPTEQLVYFGDTAHLPYGDKSTASIQAYSVKIAQFLLDQGVKMIVIACNSASAAAFDLVEAYVNGKVPVVNVIDPAVSMATSRYADAAIGVIGTKQTIQSGVYERKIHAISPATQVCALATPLLAPMIEEGFFNKNISQQIIEAYLTAPELAPIKALILGCTHYPLIRQEVEQWYQGRVEVIDASAYVALAVKQQLEHHALLNLTGTKGKDKFFVSDYTEAFEKATRIFFGQKVSLKHYPLWD
jgi:glutamate racemase